MQRLVVAVMLFGALAGCQFKGDGVAANEQSNRQLGVSDDVWLPTPNRIRIYPSSRFVITENRPALEARVELQDVMGDSIKAAGFFHLELLEDTQQKLYSWDVPINTLKDQENYFESVTRTYRFVLRLDRELYADDQLTLAVSFRRQDGILLQTKAVLGSDGVRFGL
ncbi:MAG: hypothetical protein JKX85_09455 [Phycisphaeraceae bacterium]|nr:hypothetical protein [Phycisphaeraceae bacterium]